MPFLMLEDSVAALLVLAAFCVGCAFCLGINFGRRTAAAAPRQLATGRVEAAAAPLARRLQLDVSATFRRLLQGLISLRTRRRVFHFLGNALSAHRNHNSQELSTHRLPTLRQLWARLGRSLPRR